MNHPEAVLASQGEWLQLLDSNPSNTAQTRKIVPSGLVETSIADGLRVREHVASPSVDFEDPKLGAALLSLPPAATLARLAAKARIVEQLSAGDVRVLASELRAEIEALAGPSADVVPLRPRK